MRATGSFPLAEWQLEGRIEKMAAMSSRFLGLYTDSREIDQVKRLLSALD